MMYQAVRSDGKILARDDALEGGSFAFDKSGRYVAALHLIYGRDGGVPQKVQHYSAWVLDTGTGRLVVNRRFTFRPVYLGEEPEVKWDGGRLLRIGPKGSVAVVFRISVGKRKPNGPAD